MLFSHRQWADAGSGAGDMTLVALTTKISRVAVSQENLHEIISMRLTSIFSLLIVIVPLSACRPAFRPGSAARERADPLMERAAALDLRGDVGGAVEKYRRVVLRHPDNAEAHFNLAVLLHDQTQEYVEAIYHYRVFLRLRPQSEKVGLVRDRIKNAERLYRVRLVDRVPEEGVDGIDAHAATQLRTAQRNLAASERARSEMAETLAGKEKKIMQLEQEMSELKRREASLERQLAAALRPATVDQPRTTREEPVEPDVRPSAERYYIVKPGDTLIRIAINKYGNAASWTKIRDANREVVGEGGHVQAGQKLKIP